MDCSFWVRKLPNYWTVVRRVDSLQSHFLIQLHEEYGNLLISVTHSRGICADVHTDDSHLQSKLQHLLQTSTVPVTIDTICRFLPSAALLSQQCPLQWSPASDLLLFLFASFCLHASPKIAMCHPPELHLLPDSDISRPLSYNTLLQALSLLKHSSPSSCLHPHTTALLQWISRFARTVLCLSTRSPDPGICKGLWRLPDYQFDFDVPPKAEFAKLSSQHRLVRGFHGSRTSNWYSIIRSGLEVRSWTEGMRTGAMLGTGVYFSEDASMAQVFSEAEGGWEQCPLGSLLEVVGVYDIIDIEGKVHRQRGVVGSRTPGNYIVVEDGDLVRLRSLLVWRKTTVRVRPWWLLCGIVVLILIILLYWTNQPQNVRLLRRAAFIYF